MQLVQEQANVRDNPDGLARPPIGELRYDRRIDVNAHHADPRWQHVAHADAVEHRRQHQHELDLLERRRVPVLCFEQVHHRLGQRPVVAIIYIVANIALGIHIFHGAWAMWNSLGINNPKYNLWKRYFAGGFAAVITVGYVSMPLFIVLGVVNP